MQTAEPAQRRSDAATSGGSPALMSVRGLGIRFKTSHGIWQATRKIDFDIAPGERVGIVGESGCGKTITGLSIARLLPNNLSGLDGSILFDGVDLATCSARAMRAIRGRRIAMIFQEPMSALDPVFTVGHQIAETLRVHTGIAKEEARAKTLDMLRRVGIASPERRIDDYPHQLSGGMRQRVMIAAALICGPQLLIADEPTTALDVTVQAQILQLLRDLSATSNTALMLITHDLGVVAETCTRMITMYAGEVIEDAGVDDALVRPLHPYTSGLLRSLPHLSPRGGKLPSIPGRVPSILDMPNGCRFKARCPHAVEGCEAEQELCDAGDGRKVRCWRFRELELPGALQHLASAPIAAMVSQP
ncbi:ABC transporter ATP-binding protein [Bradyrhizobium sp. Ash2021]|uniref:ABC transporter ATP-binding protein n=1 Tax=Bradyrhizobium sp. Ash2021 TaxID=2954771 RepID=UPI002814FD8C|nr:ABC transporter ATP-binding protein [Bradyrhizobium sp. Ash2021]WMT77547.1 ABC transporter ATP-binding protein [Bradyrhizobium sp. Ash2021]